MYFARKKTEKKNYGKIVNARAITLVTWLWSPYDWAQSYTTDGTLTISWSLRSWFIVNLRRDHWPRSNLFYFSAYRVGYGKGIGLSLKITFIPNSISTRFESRSAWMVFCKILLWKQITTHRTKAMCDGEFFVGDFLNQFHHLVRNAEKSVLCM